MYTKDKGGVKISKGPYLQNHVLSELRNLMNSTQHARHPQPPTFSAKVSVESLEDFAT